MFFRHKASMDEPKDRLSKARREAGFDTPTAAAKAHRSINVNTLISNENGNRAISKKYAAIYAEAFGVTAGWILFGDADAPGKHEPTIVDVPKVSWVSAGHLADLPSVTDLSEFPTVSAVDLPDGTWIALEVSGASMNRVSPPGSLIFVNLKDKRLSPGRCYVVADETGAATYKRYKPDAVPPFQPASFTDNTPPVFHGGVRVIGRVRKCIVDL